ncbi:MAG: hypothetical protein ACLPY1_01305 [Terracidiphilus sp.]
MRLLVAACRWFCGSKIAPVSVLAVAMLSGLGIANSQGTIKIASISSSAILPGTSIPVVSTSPISVNVTATGKPSGCTINLIPFGQNASGYFANVPALTAGSTTALPVPIAGLVSGFYAVQIRCPYGSTGDMKTIYIGSQPQATGLAPTSVTVSTGAAPSQTATVTGDWFGPNPNGGFISLLGVNSGRIFYISPASWSETTITFTVPETVLPGTYNVAVTAAGPQGVQNTQVPTATLNVNPAITGFVDLHAHPYGNLGFGGKLIYGAVDNLAASTAPAPANGGAVLVLSDNAGSQFVLNNSDPLHLCQRVPAASEKDALGNEGQVRDSSIPIGPTLHTSICGDALRYVYTMLIEGMTANAALWDPASYDSSGFRGASGVQDFPTWPAWNDLLNQKMQWNWIMRSWLGGQRVMVALAVNSKLLGDLTMGKGDLPDDDQATGDNQIAAIHGLIAAHPNFLQLATSSSDVLDAVSHGRMAVVIGVELDNIGNITENQCPLTMAQTDPRFTGCLQAYQKEIDRLRGEGEDVRYVFPVHLVDNPLGGSAAYDDMFNVATAYEQGTPFDLGCAAPSDGITYKYSPPPMASVLTTLALTKGVTINIPPAAAPCNSTGNVNRLGLSPLGKQVIQYMMSKQMLIDVDHMGQKSVNDAIQIAVFNTPWRYPLFSGHNGLRNAAAAPASLSSPPSSFPLTKFEKSWADFASSLVTDINKLFNKNITLPSLGSAGPPQSSERSFTYDTYSSLGYLHGMAGVGSSEIDAGAWYSMYNQVIQAMGPGISAGFGTDANGMALLSPPRTPSSLVSYPYTTPTGVSMSISTDSNQSWNYNQVGLAHYGMLPDFLQDVSGMSFGPNATPAQMTGSQVVTSMYNGAQYFYETWRLVEGNPPAPSKPPPPTFAAAPANGACPGFEVPVNQSPYPSANNPPIVCGCRQTQNFVSSGYQAGTCQCPSGQTWYGPGDACLSTSIVLGATGNPDTVGGAGTTTGGTNGCIESLCKYGCSPMANGSCNTGKLQTGLSPSQTNPADQPPPQH